MNYITNSLSEAELLVHSTRLSMVIFSWPIVFCILGLVFIIASLAWVGLFILLIGLLWALAMFLKIKFSEYGVTNRRVVFKVGVFSTIAGDLLLQQIEGVQLEQSLWGRLFNYGKIVVTGSGGTKRSITDINKPLDFKKAIEKEVAAIHKSAIV